MRRTAAFLMLVAAAGPAMAQVSLDDNDDQMRGDRFALAAYASTENNLRREFEAVTSAIDREAAVESAETVTRTRAMLRMFIYNKAVLFATCVGDSERDRPPRATPVPPSQNLMLRTCVEARFAELEKFNQVYQYASLFFTDRIASCAETARQRERERMFPPFEFLGPGDVGLYDIAAYSRCLMTAG